MREGRTGCIVVKAIEARGALLLAHLFEALLALFAEISKLSLGLLALLAEKSAKLLLFVSCTSRSIEAALAQVLVGLYLTFEKSLRLLPLYVCRQVMMYQCYR
jgi:hypothetical protein